MDVNGKSIVSVSNGNIPITPNGTGKVSVTKLELVTQAFYDAEVSISSTTIDLTAGNYQTKTMSGNVTFTITVPTGPSAGFVTLIGHSSTAYTVAWPSSSPKCTWLTTAITSITAGKTFVIAWKYDGTNVFLSCPGGVTTP